MVSPLEKRRPRQEAEPEVETKITELWKKYGFLGKPPRPGTPVEERVLAKCQEYADYLLKSGLGTELTDPFRKRLHNELAIMTVGKDRKELDDVISQKIADFACQVTFGLKMNEFFAQLERDRGQRNYEKDYD